MRILYTARKTAGCLTACPSKEPREIYGEKKASIYWDLLYVKHPAECFTYLFHLILITPLRGWYEWLYSASEETQA